MPHTPTLGNASASKRNAGSFGDQFHEPRFSRAQLDGAVVALVPRLRPHRIAAGLQRRGRLGLPSGPHRGPRLIPDIPGDFRLDRSAVGEETQLEGRRLVLQGQLLRLPAPDPQAQAGADADEASRSRPTSAGAALRWAADHPIPTVVPSTTP